jgi:hypothetical protein
VDDIRDSLGERSTLGVGEAERRTGADVADDGAHVPCGIDARGQDASRQHHDVGRPGPSESGHELAA